MRDRPQPIPEKEQEFKPIDQERSDFFDILKSRGVLEEIDDKMIYDTDAVRNLLRRDPEHPYQKLPLDFDMVVQELRGLKGYRKSDVYDPRFTAGQLPPREVLIMPESLADLNGQYPRAAEEAVVNPWDLAARISWSKRVQLASGEETNLAEMFIAAELGRFKSRRNQAQELELFNPELGRYQKFSSSAFAQLTGRKMWSETNTRLQVSYF